MPPIIKLSVVWETRLQVQFLKRSVCEFVCVLVCVSLGLYLVQPLLPAVLPFDHELDAVGERGQDAGGGRLESDGLPLEVNAVDPLGAGGRKH